ncbi:MAG: hypothetical protein JJU10_10185 [Idiomarina sp.]|nr:hypothetical protein [Idiomarina sp.]
MPEDLSSNSFTALISGNVDQLDRLQNLIKNLSNAQYSKPSRLPHQPSVGRHVRHVIEHYLQLLLSLTSGVLDYSLRSRDVQFEESLAMAIEQISEIQEKLTSLSIPSTGSAVQNQNIIFQANNQKFSTNLARELDFLNSHTVHHLALIQIITQEFGIPADRRTGIHPTTLEHLDACAR